MPFPSPGDLPDPDPSKASLVVPNSSQGSFSFPLGWCPLLPQPQVRAFHFLLLAPDLALILLRLLLPAPPPAACGGISTEKCHHYLTVRGNFSISHKNSCLFRVLQATSLETSALCLPFPLSHCTHLLPKSSGSSLEIFSFLSLLAATPPHHLSGSWAAGVCHPKFPGSSKYPLSDASSIPNILRCPSTVWVT